MAHLSVPAAHPPRRWYASPWLHLSIIVLVAGFLRLWHLWDIPPGLFGDEATDGLDALDILAGHGAIFFPANYGREGLHMWLLAGMFRVLGVNPLALRLPSAVAGILTAAATYWLGLELWRADRAEPSTMQRNPPGGRGLATGFRFSPWVALLASLYVASSFWHIHFSRFGIRGVFTPLFGALAFASFWRAANAGQPSEACDGAGRASAGRYYAWFAASGCFLGLSAHFYTAGRLYPVMFAVYLVFQAWVARARHEPCQSLIARHWRGILLLYAMAALVFSPLGLYFVQHPGSFTQRAGEVASGSVSQLVRSVLANLLQFGLPGAGDQAQFYNLPGRPVFDPVSFALAIVGLAGILWRVRRAASLFIVAWCCIMLAPAFLATDRFPSLPRALGLIPAVYFLPAAGVVCLASLIRRKAVFATGALLGGLAVALHAGLASHDYFVRWGPSAATFDAFEGDMVLAWKWLQANEPAGHVYLSSDIYRHPTFMLLNEHATVSDYFDHRSSSLSWFDARSSLPLPRPGEATTYILGSSAPLAAPGTDALTLAGVERARIDAPDGRPALIVMQLPPDDDSSATGISLLPHPIAFSGTLALLGASWVPTPDDTVELRLLWQASGPVQGDWRGYNLEVATPDGTLTSPLGFQPPEWISGGRFITWHDLRRSEPRPEVLQMRLVHSANGLPLAVAGSSEGWQAIAIDQTSS